MARIHIEDLPTSSEFTPGELDKIFGAGRWSFRPSLESFEKREMYAVDLGAALNPGMMSEQSLSRTNTAEERIDVRPDARPDAVSFFKESIPLDSPVITNQPILDGSKAVQLPAGVSDKSWNKYGWGKWVSNSDGSYTREGYYQDVSYKDSPQGTLVDIPSLKLVDVLKADGATFQRTLNGVVIIQATVNPFSNEYTVWEFTSGGIRTNKEVYDRPGTGHQLICAERYDYIVSDPTRVPRVVDKLALDDLTRLVSRVQKFPGAKLMTIQFFNVSDTQGISPKFNGSSPIWTYAMDANGNRGELLELHASFPNGYQYDWVKSAKSGPPECVAPSLPNG